MVKRARVCVVYVMVIHIIAALGGLCFHLHVQLPPGPLSPDCVVLLMIIKSRTLVPLKAIGMGDRIGISRSSDRAEMQVKAGLVVCELSCGA